MKNFFSVLRIFIFLAILMLGMYMRAYSTRFTTLAENTVASYYYDRFQRLIADGRLPEADVWGFAPSTHAENVPPGLPYLTAAFLPLWKLSGTAANDLLAYANYFPMFFFILWAVCLWVLFALRERNYLKAVIALTALAFAPEAISLTSYTLYFEEVPGVFFLFFTLYFWSKLDGRKVWDLIGATISLVLLILTWQQFPFAYAVGGLGVLAAIVFRQRNIATLLSISMVSALALSEGISRLVVDIDYSPVGMIGEAILGILYYRSPDLVLAMTRADWAGVHPLRLINYFGPLSIFLVVLGLWLGVTRWKMHEYRLSLLGALVGLALIIAMHKERHLAFAALLLPISLAAQEFSSHQWNFASASAFIRRIITKVRNRVLLAPKVTLIICLAIIVFFIRSTTNRADPVPKVSFSAQRLDDATISVQIRMENAGASTLNKKEAFAGFHVEVENAEILASRVVPSKYRPGTKAYAREGDRYFFEVKIPRLKSGEVGEIYLRVAPESGKQAKIYWRGWMPKSSCTRLARQSVAEDLSIAWRVPENFWRAEECIVRVPANNDEEHTLCPIRVFAAHEELQSFRCFEESI